MGSTLSLFLMLSHVEAHVSNEEVAWASSVSGKPSSY